MRLIEFCVHNPVKVAVGVLIIVIFGTLSLWRMPIQLTPAVESPTISLETRWPGASPHEVEHEIIQQQEKQLQNLEGMVKMTSESTYSRGRISIEFTVGTNIPEALVKVNARLQQVREYPQGADEPTIRTSNLLNRPVCWYAVTLRLPTTEELDDFVARKPHLAQVLEPVRTAHKWDLVQYRLLDIVRRHPETRDLLPKELDITKMRRFVEDHVAPRFGRVNGVGDTYVTGGREEEVQVIVDPRKLAARKLTIEQVRKALREQNRNTSGGNFWEGKRSYAVRILGQYVDLEQIKKTIVIRQQGVPVYIKDVAKVRFGFKKPTEVYRRAGAEMIGIGCRPQSGANVVQLISGVRQVVQDLNNGFLKQHGLQLNEAWAESDYIQSAVRLVNWNIVIGGLLTIGVLLCFLGSGRSTLVIALAVPTSIVGTFLVLNMLGRTLNVISLAGLAFAVGMLVDNSVVVLENIFRHHQNGDSAFRSAVRGTSQVWGAILASTLTTLAVFIPVLFIQEQAGQLFRDIALAISAAVAISLVVAVTVIPTASARIFRRNGSVAGEASQGTWLSRSFVTVFVSINRWLQPSVPLRLLVVFGFVGAAVLISYLLFPAIEYLPNGNKNRVDGRMQPPPGYNVDQLKTIGHQVMAQLKPYWDAKPGSKEAEELDFPLIQDVFIRGSSREIRVGVRASDRGRVRDLLPLLRSICETVPGMNVSTSQVSLFGRESRTINVEIVGPELERLTQIGREIRAEVRQLVPGAQVSAWPSLDLSTPEVHVKPKWEQASELGISAEELGYLVNALVDGAYASDYSVGGDKIDLRILGQERLASRIQDLESLPIASPDGEIIPLSTIAKVQLSTGPLQINHHERRRSVTIRVRPPATMALGSAVDTISEQIVGPRLNGGELSGEYTIELKGTADRLRQTWWALRFNFLLAIVITYLLMAALFESWLYPFVIIFSVPLAAVGGFGGIWIVNQFVHQPLDIITMLGFVILIGTSVNNAILIVHQSLNFMRDDNMSSGDAILASVKTRIRPIFMTTATTVLGLSPLVVMPGAGSELYRGLGSVVLGGLVVSTVFTLILVPVLFSLTMQAFDRQQSGGTHPTRS